eukprot:g831.t1
MVGYVSSDIVRFVTRCLCEWRSLPWLVVPLLVGEVLLCALIILRVPYTKIDWDAYMEEVAGPLERGVWDYAELRGETGPLVYPAGFVYLYGALRWLGGGDGSDVRAMQWVFAGVYVATQALVVAVYARARPRGMPPWALLLLCVSKRMHSLYVLRLFNDCWAMLLLYAALFVFTRARPRWYAGCALFSLAVAVKANVLLFAPGLAVLLTEALGLHGALRRVGLCAAVQLVLGAPFLLGNAAAYIGRAFGGFGDLNQKWSVNWKCLSEEVFFSRRLALGLLTLHLGALLYLGARKWCGRPGLSVPGMLVRLMTRREPEGGQARALRPDHVAGVLLASNFVGIVCFRSLHFQFYCWYWHALPFLLWRCEALPLPCKLAVLAALEYAWSYGLDPAEGTSTPLSSAVLQMAHVVAVAAVFATPAGPVFCSDEGGREARADGATAARKKKQ